MALQTTPLADPADLAVKLGKSADDAGVVLALNLASERFRGQTRNPISLVQHDSIVLDGAGTRVMRLPVWPVTEVVSVTVANVTVTDPEWSADGLLRLHGRFPDRWRSVQVVYSHGHDPVPGDVQEVVLDQAASISEANPWFAQVVSGQEQEAYSTAATVGTTSQWAHAVAKYRIGGDRW
jgi:hypothetical protein